MFRGRYQLGEEIPLGCRTLTAADVPTAPDDCPTMTISTAAGSIALSRKIPICDRYGVTGLFLDNVQLNTTFAAGAYIVNYVWVIGGTVLGDTDTFEIVAGGNADGACIASHFFDRPHADFIVQQVDSGQVVYGRNPKVG